MIVRTYIKVLNTMKESYIDKDGNSRELYKVNYSQDSDRIVGTLNVRKDIFETLEKGKNMEYELTGEYKSGRNGNNYISWSYAKLASQPSKPLI